MVIDLIFLAWFLFRFWKKRNMSEQEWEKAYGKYDERDDAIEGRAARLTLKAGVFILMLLNGYVFSTPREVVASVVLTIACAAIYALSKEYYEERM